MKDDEPIYLEIIEKKLDRIIELLSNINANISPKNVELLLETSNINYKQE